MSARSGPGRTLMLEPDAEYVGCVAHSVGALLHVPAAEAARMLDDELRLGAAEDNNVWEPGFSKSQRKDGIGHGGEVALACLRRRGLGCLPTRVRGAGPDWLARRRDGVWLLGVETDLGGRHAVAGRSWRGHGFISDNGKKKRFPPWYTLEDAWQIVRIAVRPPDKRRFVLCRARGRLEVLDMRTGERWPPWREGKGFHARVRDIAMEKEDDRRSRAYREAEAEAVAAA